MACVEEHQYTVHIQTNFNFIKRLGKGGFGVVCKATNKQDGLDYAIKRIEYPESEKRQKKVLREVESLARLDHPNVVGYTNAWFETCTTEVGSIWANSSDEESGPSSQENGTSSPSSADSDYFRQKTTEPMKSESTGLVCFKSESNKRKISDDQNDIVTQQMKTKYSKTSKESSAKRDASKGPKMYLFIQMELCEDDNLHNWLERNEIRIKEEVVLIFHEILEAVAYIHKKNVIHRDLKPTNIFFCSNGHIKVGDFGLARPMLSLQDMIDGQSQEYSPGVGTPIYMSPEQLMLKPYNESVDIYSLGIIWFEMLVFFKTQSERYKVLNSVKDGNYPIEFCGNFPGEFDVLKLMLSLNPVERPSAETLKFCCKSMYASYFGMIDSDSLFK